MGKRKHWLLKTEPSEWSWAEQTQAAGGVSRWDGVKNRQAQNNMRSMRLGDLCFFYHSGKGDRRIVGVVEVVKPWYEDPEKGDGAVDVRSVGEMRRAVGLEEIKREEGEVMKGFALLKQPRLSVVPVPASVWERICEMGGGFGEAAAAAEEEEE
ncbi:putative EVE domain, PUA-like superfamily protein [Dioscorea sansibarensis]